DQSTVHSFPQVHASGYVMQLIDSGEFLKVAVTSKAAQSSEVYLFVHARQIIAHADKQLLNNNQAVFRVRKNDLSEGISHFTVFNDDLQPLCERLYFTYPRKKLDIGIAANQKVFNPRQKVVLSLDIKDDSGKPAAANMSMSVFRIDSLSKETAPGIYPYLWLTSDLIGEIESPEYYFHNVEPQVAADMDNLMLTHGWRRFDWSEVITKEAVVRFLPEVRGHIITAMIMKDKAKQRGVFSYLGSPGKIIRAYGSWSNAEGEVRFEIKDFYGPRRIIVQTRTDSTQTYDVEIQNPFSSVTDEEKLPELKINAKSGKDLLSRSVAMQVQDIYYYEQHANSFVRPTVDSSAFYGKADDTYLLDDYTRFPVMEEVMREYVPGVFVRKRRDGFHFIVIDKVNGGVLPGDPMVLLDGVPVFDVDDVMKVDPLQVRKLEVVNRYYYLGQAVFSGIVSYTTYQGNLGGLELSPGSVSMDYEGLQLKRKFFSPQYARNINDRLPDQRYLLHWQPDIVTDENGKQKVEFYTSDVPGLYSVVVEGLSVDGFSGSRTFTFPVQTSGNP
ncbi:MAG TPA: hypothetical protein VFO54_03125, partial [Chryseosolibacter sp.]|nr:hypothetical protein [Chryseosolibacter sp.]